MNLEENLSTGYGWTLSEEVDNGDIKVEDLENGGNDDNSEILGASTDHTYKITAGDTKGGKGEFSAYYS